MIKTFDIPVTSSAISRIAYTDETGKLSITFTSGHTSELNVSLAVARNFLNAPSKGKYYNRVLRGLAERPAVCEA